MTCTVILICSSLLYRKLYVSSVTLKVMVSLQRFLFFKCRYVLVNPPSQLQLYLIVDVLQLAKKLGEGMAGWPDSCLRLRLTDGAFHYSGMLNNFIYLMRVLVHAYKTD